MDSNFNNLYINEKSFIYPKLESHLILNTLTEYNAKISQEILRLDLYYLLQWLCTYNPLTTDMLWIQKFL